MIERSDIEKLATLARIKVSNEEAESLRGEIDAVLGYVSELQKVEVGEIGMPEKNDFPVRNVLREDGTPHESGAHTDALLAEAPASENGYVKVKKIL